MEYSIGVEIEHTKYIEILSKDGHLRSPIDLTTIKPRQKRAIIRFVIFFKQKKREIGSMNLDLNREKNDKPLIALVTRLARKRLVVAATPEGLSTVRAEYPFGRFVFPYAAVIGSTVAAVLLILALIWGLPLLTSIRPATTSPATEREAAPVPAEPAVANNTAPAPTEAAAEAAETASEAPAPTAEAAEPAAKSEPAAVDPRQGKSTKRVVVYFGAEDATLLPGAVAALREFLADLANLPVTAVDINGHASPWGAKSNLDDLSRERAENVAGFLASSAGSLPEDARVQGFGASVLAREERSEARFNRRVEVIIYY